MIFALIFIVIFSIAIVTIPIAWLGQTHDWKMMFVFAFIGCGVCYMLDTEIVYQMFCNIINMCINAPWSGGL